MKGVRIFLWIVVALIVVSAIGNILGDRYPLSIMTMVTALLVAFNLGSSLISSPAERKRKRQEKK